MKSYNKKSDKSKISDENGVRTYTYKTANGKERKIKYSKDKQPSRKNNMTDKSERYKRTQECYDWITKNKKEGITCYALEKQYRSTGENCVARNTFYKLYKKSNEPLPENQ